MRPLTTVGSACEKVSIRDLPRHRQPLMEKKRLKPLLSTIAEVLKTFLTIIPGLPCGPASPRAPGSP